MNTTTLLLFLTPCAVVVSLLVYAAAETGSPLMYAFAAYTALTYFMALILLRRRP